MDYYSVPGEQIQSFSKNQKAPTLFFSKKIAMQKSMATLQFDHESIHLNNKSTMNVEVHRKKKESGQKISLIMANRSRSYS